MLTISHSERASRKSRRSTRFTKAEVKRAVEGVCQAGFQPRGVDVFPDGRISIQLVDDASTQSGSWDDVLK